MDGVVSGIFLILKSGLRNDGKRKTKAGGESSGAKMGTSLTQNSFPLYGLPQLRKKGNTINFQAETLNPL